MLQAIRLLLPGIKPTKWFFGVLLAFGFTVGNVEAGTVKGLIAVDGGKKIRNLIIYLEPADGQSIGGGEEVTVSQKNSAFDPPFNVVVKGRKVLFSNDEEKLIDHNVYSLSELAKFDIGLNGKGTVKEVPFNEVGSFKFYCSVHKTMEGVIGVVPTPYFAKLSKPGEFKIDNVPPGKWTIKAMISHRRYNAEPVEQEVAEGAPTAVQLTVSKKSRKKKKTALPKPSELAMTPIDIVIPENGSRPIVVNLSIGSAEARRTGQ